MGRLDVVIRVWMVSLSRYNSKMLPEVHVPSLRFSAVACSFALDCFDGFCNNSWGITMTHFHAMGRRADLLVQAFIKRVTSRIKSFPALPDGSLKRFFRQ